MRAKRTFSRRTFLKGSAAGIAGAAAASMLNVVPAMADEEVTTEILTPDEEMECDVVVLGLGCAGVVAAAKAAQDGASVIGIEIAEDMTLTTNVRTSGAFAVESKGQLEYDNHKTVEEVFQYMLKETHYQHNAKSLHSILQASGRAIDLLQDGGMEWIVSYPDAKPDGTWMDYCGHRYGLKGTDRADCFQKILDDAGVQCIYSARANVLLEEDGVVCGVQADQEGKCIHVKAKAVICCCGGFLNNEDMVAKYFGGAKIVNIGCNYSNGDGIAMVQKVGGQIGKNFCVSLNEYGGANPKSKVPYAFRHNLGENETLRIPILGGLLVDCNGKRFIDEGIVAEDAMFTSEPMLRESYYYAIVDDAFMEMIATTPLPDLISVGHTTEGSARIKTFFDGATLTDIRDQFDEAVSEGWAWKADSIEELAEIADMPDLVETVEEYNAFCEEGVDPDFYKNKAYLDISSVHEGPFYLAQYLPSAWLSMGGIKCDKQCEALNMDNKRIPGLYVAGADADIYSVPYFQGGSANGFALASGYICGEAAAAYAKK